MSQNLINALIFQSVWWAVLILQSRSQFTEALFAGLAGGLAQMFVIRQKRFRYFILWISISVLGLAFDVFSAKLNWIGFNDGGVPWWLLPIWFQLACSLNLSMSIFLKRPWIAFLFGFLFSPLSYFGASKWGVFSYNQELPSPIIYAIAWGAFFVLILQIAKKGERYVLK